MKYSYKGRNIYDHKRKYQSPRTSRIDDRMDEEAIDILIAASKQFRIRQTDIADRIGFNRHVVRNIFNKIRYCRKDEYTILYNTMRIMMCETMGLTLQQAAELVNTRQRK